MTIGSVRCFWPNCPQTIVLADRAYDADWIRQFIREQGAWANIPPKKNRTSLINFSPDLYR
jgi:transposase